MACPKQSNASAFWLEETRLAQSSVSLSDWKSRAMQMLTQDKHKKQNTITIERDLVCLIIQVTFSIDSCTLTWCFEYINSLKGQQAQSATNNINRKWQSSDR
jgi:hypothetical protein